MEHIQYLSTKISVTVKKVIVLITIVHVFQLMLHVQYFANVLVKILRMKTGICLDDGDDS